MEDQPSDDKAEVCARGHSVRRRGTRHDTRFVDAGAGFAARAGREARAERMRRAASLLVSGASNVKEVARDCGFDDPNYLAKAFRSRFGASPTQFRTTGMYSDNARRNGD